jgi:DEAD/DEAH box helicase domain-containing protein
MTPETSLDENVYTLDNLLDTLREFDAIRDSSEHQSKDEILTRSLESLPPTFASDEIFENSPPSLRSALEKLGISQLYSHQAEAIAKAVGGADVVLESPTASGKTLSFIIPLIIKLLAEPSAHALMLHPMKALSNDQRRQFEELAGAFGGSRVLDSWLYDGDTEQEHRSILRKNPPAVLFTNPEMLHQSFLGWSEQWEKFLKNLRVVVIDEMHEYRGFFGTNAALLLRRFFRKLADLGATPQIILATATCANPIEHAERLTGRKNFQLVKAETTMRPERHFAFIKPDIPDFKYHDIYKLRVVRAALACLKDGLTTIVFCPSRKFAESASVLAKKDAEKFELDPEVIKPYRSGYTSADRREIEDGLREGKYKIVFCTNALEIGIDVGRLDCCILAGFPDNVMSAWQRIGRTGRSWKKSAFVLFFALNNAMDQFFASNIDAFLNRPLDEILIGIDNEELMQRHIPYLLSEANWQLDEDQKEILGEAFLEAGQVVTKTQRAIAGSKPHYQRLDIRGASGQMWHLKVESSGKEIGTIAETQRFREAHLGAIYNHLGETFRVVGQGVNEIFLESAEPYLKTEPILWTVIQNSEILRGVRYKESVGAFYGKATIYDNFGGYRVEDSRTGNVIETVTSNAAIPRNVRAFWLAIENNESFQNDPAELKEGFPVIEQFARIGSSFMIPCDRHDMATWTDTKLIPTVYLYETVPGGIGIAEKMLDMWQSVLVRGMELAKTCDCTEGCPRCIHPPRYRPADVGALRKTAGFEFMGKLMALTCEPPDESFDPMTHGWRSYSGNVEKNGVIYEVNH